VDVLFSLAVDAMEPERANPRDDLEIEGNREF